ncbi:SDR family NAD(P)-dependent oxidoreductase [Oceanicoccus sp. KOV_DT_Chl]|uniref:SDR family NAD(P)-dependent oxidoreductase n=1 Tax=Oceanicoccus sp. KOV_DT_Chl TaxID=1904639 RepID=UPI000C7B62D2|nr:SDR family NAD(P)-dependent oxidoreductase [Oceanicoccus sp. KOV_DT_Chl]
MVFTVHSTTDEVVADLELSSTVAIITGASGGLGAETARALAAKGATVVLVARDADKLAAQAQEIISSTGNAKVFNQVMDLADLDSVRSAAQTLLETYPVINVLINNAGIMACPYSQTVQGF